MRFATDRRSFLKTTIASSAAFAALPSWASDNASKPLFKISVAEWSLHRTLKSGKMDNLEFPGFVMNEFGIDAVEYVNQFFKDKPEDNAYLVELKRRAEDANVKTLLIMVDGEGRLGDPNDAERTKAVENHYKWVDASKFLGGHSIRVNAASDGTYGEQRDLATDGLRRLSEFAAEREMNVIVENHGGLSSNGAWLAEVIKQVGLENCGTLPDFGNFRTGNNDAGEEVWYDRYRGVEELMPFAKAVSAKSHVFDDEGNEINTDFLRMMKIVLKAGYRGYVGIEWEGNHPNEVEGIRLTQKLLERVRDQLTQPS